MMDLKYDTASALSYYCFELKVPHTKHDIIKRTIKNEMVADYLNAVSLSRFDQLTKDM